MVIKMVIFGVNKFGVRKFWRKQYWCKTYSPQNFSVQMRINRLSNRHAYKLFINCTIFMYVNDYGKRFLKILRIFE